MIKNMSQVSKNKNLGEIQKKRIIQWRREKTVTRLDKPTRISRARSLGYKAKHGFVVARVRVGKGKRKRPKFKGGRVPKKMGRFFPPGKSKQLLGEERVARKFPNLKVLNSYYVGDDGQYEWFEVILLDSEKSSVSKDKERKCLADKQHKGRVFRSLTSSGKKIRGLRK